MRSSFFKYSILLLLGLALILSTCAHGNGNIVDPTPDITIPSTLQVIVTITENQDASDGKYGSSDVTLQFSTNEIAEANIVTFIHGESINCNGQSITLGNAPNYPVHIIINNNALIYNCIYRYPQGKTEPIFNVAMGTQLTPKLQRPVPSNSVISVSYNPDKNPPHYCQIQVTASAMGQTPAPGDSVQEDGGIYTGPNVSPLRGSGQGNLVMTRTCVPPQYNYDHHNHADDTGLTFDAVNLTYKSIASYEVLWAP